MEIITVSVQKGGTGKSVTAAALAAEAVQDGKRVLAIDLDGQGNLSFMLGADPSETGTFELFQGVRPEELIQETDSGIDIISASWKLSTVKSSQGSARRLQDGLKGLERYYDLVILDTPPNGGELQYNALQAATGLIAPVQADIFGLQAYYLIRDAARQFRGRSHALPFLGVIITQYNRQATITRQMRETIQKTVEADHVPYLGEVRKAVAISEAAALQIPLLKYAPKSKPVEDYRRIYRAAIAPLFSPGR